MKTYLLTCMSIILFCIAACDQKRGKEASQQEADSLAATSERECYIAVFEKDTAYMNIERTEKSKVLGDLLIKYGENPKNEGKFTGDFRGDTLFVTYTYTVGTYTEKIIQNPLAFLAKGDSLILGIGQIETYVGRSYFKKGAPIDFDKGRFRFVKTECKE
jgi:hypothetical protein